MSDQPKLIIEIGHADRLEVDRCILEVQDAEPRHSGELGRMHVMPLQSEGDQGRLRLTGVPELLLPLLRQRGIAFVEVAGGAGGADVNTDEQLAIERVAKARKRLEYATSVYGRPAEGKVVTQADLDEIEFAKAELAAALAAKDQIFDEIRSGKRP